MSKANPLSGLIGHYGDSDDDSDEEMSRSSKMRTDLGSTTAPSVDNMTSMQSAATFPPPVQHCPWSACYDETTGFTYYWNQYTNAVTWEAPPEYLLAVKLAQQQLSTSGSTEVSAEEWQLYQQALAEQQTAAAKAATKPPPVKANKLTDNKPNNGKSNSRSNNSMKNGRAGKKRSTSDSEDEKIELITSYYHSDSESNDEADSPTKKPTLTPSSASVPNNPKAPTTPKPPLTPKSTTTPKPVKKKQKTKPQTVEFGPTLPPNQNYTVPIGPELPPDLVVSDIKPKSPEVVKETPVAKESSVEVHINTKKIDNEDEDELLKILKEKADLLEKLGGELPNEIQEIIKEENSTRVASPAKIDETSRESSKSTMDTNIDDLLEEIEKKELPQKIKSKGKIDIFGDDTNVVVEEKQVNSGKSTPKDLSRCSTPSKDEVKPLFPSSKSIVEEPQKTLFPSAANIDLKSTEPEVKTETPSAVIAEKKVVNIYLANSDEVVEKPSRKKLRISNSVLPERKASNVPEYTTKYSQVIEGFSGERTGLGFSRNVEDEETTAPKKPFVYGKGLMFTKGETLNEDKDDGMEDSINLLEAKLKFLNEQQMYAVSPVQEMTIQMQTLLAAHLSSALSASYLRRWSSACAASLARLERSAAPPGWTLTFQRSAGRYQYRRDSDGLTQWEYPAGAPDDMDISTTPPHPGVQDHAPAEVPPPPPPPPAQPPLPPAPAPPPPPPLAAPPPPPAWDRVPTPPPPAWGADPPPPGCDDAPVQPSTNKKEIGDELLSFYNDIAELEKVTPAPPPAPALAPPSPPGTPPPPPPPPPLADPPSPERAAEPEHRVAEKHDKSDAARVKKKSKVKISSSMGLKHKTVSTLVAKWQQVADEINSD